MNADKSDKLAWVNDLPYCRRQRDELFSDGGRTESAADRMAAIREDAERNETRVVHME